MGFLGSLSIPVFLCVFFIFFLILTAFLLWFRTLPSPEEVEKSESTIVVISALSITMGGFYAILFGLVLVNLWGNFSSVQQHISQEANDMALLYFGSSAFPKETRLKLQQNIKEYVLEVRQNEWKIITREGASSEKAWNYMWQIFTTLQSYVPQSTNEIAVYNSMLSSLHNSLDARRTRIDETDSSIPPTLFAILVMGCIFVIYSNAEMARRSANRFIVLNVAINFILAFYLTLIVDLSRPYNEGQFTSSYNAFSLGVLETI